MLNPILTRKEGLIMNELTPPQVFEKQTKDTELKRVFKAFYTGSKTMKEVDLEIGIMRESICWYCRTLRTSKRLYNTGKRFCKVTKRFVNTWSTNPELQPPQSQLSFF